jgi:hypothetical protein
MPRIMKLQRAVKDEIGRTNGPVSDVRSAFPHHGVEVVVESDKGRGSHVLQAPKEAQGRNGQRLVEYRVM